MKVTRVREAVSFRIVGMTSHHRSSQPPYAARIHLAIAIDLYGYIRSASVGFDISRHHSAADTAILIVFDNDDAGILATVPHHLAASLRTAIVHDDNQSDLWPDVGNDPKDVRGNAVCGDDHRDG